MLISLIVVVLLVIIPLLLFYHFHTSKFNYWKDRGVPHEQPHPIFGNMRESTLFRAHQAEVFESLYNKFPQERFVGFYQWYSPTILVRDPELAKSILQNDFAHFHSRGVAYDVTEDPLTANLITLDHSHWRSLRSKLTSAFSSGQLKAMLPLVEECARGLVQQVMNAGETTEIRSLLQKYSMDVIGTYAFGIDIEALTDPNSQFCKIGMQLNSPSYRTSIHQTARFICPGTAKALGLRQFPKAVTTFFCNLVRDVLEHRQSSGLERNDFMQILLSLRKARDEETKELKDEKSPLVLTDNILTAQAFVFFMAGFESTSASLSLCLYALAQHPDIQKRVREELYKAMDNSPNDAITYNIIQELKYMHQVMLETFRRYPPAGMIMRRCNEDYKVPNSSLVIESGVQVMIPVKAIHMDPQYYPEPSCFDPERFNSENIRKKHPFSFLGFGHGPRVCIGKRFALLQMKMALAHLIYNYEVQVCPETITSVKYNPKLFVLQSADDIILKFIPHKKEMSQG